MTDKIDLLSILFSLSLIFISQAALSQYVEKNDHVQKIPEEKEGYIGLGVGFSNPNGIYAEQDLSNFYNGSGFAKTGYNVNISYGKLFTANLGLALSLSYSSHGFNTDEIKAFYRLNDPLASHNIVAGRYSTTGLLGGILLSFPLHNGYFDIRAMIGYSSSFAPSYKDTRRDSTFTDYIEINSSTSGALSSNFGVGFRLNINEILALNFSLDYYFTKPVFHHTFTSNSTDPQAINYTLRMSMLNTTIGIVYRIPSF